MVAASGEDWKTDLDALIGLFIAILVAILICAAICLVAWGLLALIDLIPVLPAFLKRILQIVVYVFAGLFCIVVTIKAISGGNVLPMMLTGWA